MPNEPVSYKGVMVSSTFTDLVEHRKALIKAINGQKLMSVVMEHDSAKPAVDVLDSSLQMVRDASAYVSVISHKYGQIPEDPKRNPEGLSLTELEFNEAGRLGRLVLLFIMGVQHPVTLADVETDPGKKQKLLAFTERAKRMSSVDRVYKVFNSLQEFEVAAMQSIAELRRHLDTAPEPEDVLIPTPPAFYAEPPYIGSHVFVGRETQLVTLSDWAAAADPHPVLLFEAIGGSGKSMLTWEWTTKHATSVRKDWAGRFWYSFYEKGAVMADFCQRALAYMTGRPLQGFRKKKTAELSQLLLQQLRARPWLLVLDGLERVLVAYHRIDAAQLADEEAGGSDEIARRDPCAAIRPEDDDLLRALASATPSKLLLTSRLIPRVLLNPSSQAIPGVLHERLHGLRSPDAEKLLRSCGVTGSSHVMQSYLKSHCDCHPLVTGVLAGLINNYFPDRGNFDAWATAPDAGAVLDLSGIDLVQKRNHILRAALDALSEKSRQLLSTLALLSEAVNSTTLSALNPHLAAPEELANTVRDLEDRGLLQYDRQSKRYDLHPVVRGIAAGGLRQEDKESYGRRVVDHFSQQSHNPYEDAETLEDVRLGLQIMRALIQMGHYQEAAGVYRDELANALTFNLEAHATAISVLRPFFSQGWGSLPARVQKNDASYLAGHAGIVLRRIGETMEALRAHGVGLQLCLQDDSWPHVVTQVYNISAVLRDQNRLAAVERCGFFRVSIASLIDDSQQLFLVRLDRFADLALIGRWADAEEMWNLLDPMGRNWNRTLYRAGNAETLVARFRHNQGTLTEEHLTRAEELARFGRNRRKIRELHGLRGEWLLSQGNWELAASSLHEAVRMAREVAQNDATAEARLALANFHLGRLADPRQAAEQLSAAKNPSHGDLAALWLAIGDREQAKKHALDAYKWAWADGEPYVWRYELNKARTLLEQLGVEIPNLPPYDPDKDEKFPWEQDVADAIERLRAEKQPPL